MMALAGPVNGSEMEGELLGIDQNGTARIIA
ncbi:hypothetical protein JOH51_003242 [Rhizobium leguminosarum]|nr:hypothetical protein [Rhizobium leguminosarum]